MALFQKYNNSFDKDRNSEIIVGEEEKQTLQAYLKSNGFTEEECKKIVLGYNSFFKEIEKDIKKRKKQLEKQTKENEKFKNKYGLERSKLSPLEQKFVKQVFKLELIKLMELPHLLQLSESPNIYIRRYLGHKFDEREWEKINENLPCIKEIVNQILKQQEEKCLESDWNAGIIIAKDRAQERKKHIDSLQQNME
ncbi:MAG: hypothetical protein LBP53_00415 [Candidatus Peribacteria bacterium]|nr:hypothetical protein [Candidatus Peribacteria bacterium]